MRSSNAQLTNTHFAAIMRNHKKAKKKAREKKNKTRLKKTAQRRLAERDTAMKRLKEISRSTLPKVDLTKPLTQKEVRSRKIKITALNKPLEKKSITFRKAVGGVRKSADHLAW